MIRAPRSSVALPLALLLGALLAGPSPVPATTLVALDTDQLIDRSTVIVTGSCVSARSEWRDGFLVTVARVEVERSLAGEAGSHVDVVLPGGVDLDRDVPVAVSLPGAPSLVPGERVLLFLYDLEGPVAEHAVTGLFQGKLALREGPGGATLVRKPGRVRGGGAGTMPLAALEERIALRKGAAGTGGAR